MLFGSSSMSPKSLNEVQQYLRSLFLLDQGRYVALSQEDKGQDLQAKGIIEEIIGKHTDPINPVSIEEVYCFECALLKLEPIDKIRRMGWNTRATYRALAGPGQYDLYLKSDPPDLQGLGPATGTAPGPLLTGQALLNNEIALRADMHILTGEIFRILSLIPQRERLRNRTAQSIGALLVWFWLMVLIVGIVTNIWGIIYNRSGQIWVIFPVCVAGATGAFMSVQRRLQNLPIADDATIGFYALYYGRKSLILSPIAGVVFSGLLYLIFSGGLVTGALFPRIVNNVAHAPDSPKEPAKRPANAAGSAGASTLAAKTPVPDAPGTTAAHNTSIPEAPTKGLASAARPDAPTAKTPVSDTPVVAVPAVKTPATSASDPAETRMNFLDYAYHTGPANGTEWAKLLVWSFLAGFAEQLVPDILNRIASRQAAIENTKEVKTG